MTTLRSAALLAALALAACGEAGTGSAGTAGIAFFVDARSGGASGFWFLPPIAPEPDDATPNHRGLSPVVQVAELPPGTAGVIATFDAVKDAGAHYQADWAASDAPLVPGGLYRIEVLLDGATLGYADAEVADDGGELRFLYSEETFPLTGERTLPIKFRIAEPAPDADGDLVPDAGDDCPSVPDAIQVDTDEDGIGDACECLDVACEPVDACHLAGSCDTASGGCSSPTAPDGTSCPLAEGTGACEAGQCVSPDAGCGACEGCDGGCVSCTGTTSEMTSGTCPVCGGPVGGCSCERDCATCSGSTSPSGGGMEGSPGMESPTSTRSP